MLIEWPAEHNLCLQSPIDRWDEAIPLGNGLLGVLLWGEGPTIRLSLDRGDLWDLRTPEPFQRKEWNWAMIKNLVAKKDQAGLIELFERPYELPYPTKIPAGRIELTFDKTAMAENFCLDLCRAVGLVNLKSCQMEVFCSATAPVAMIRVKGAKPDLKIVPPAFSRGMPMSANGVEAGSLGRLGYPAPQNDWSGNVRWTKQDCADGFQYAIIAGSNKVADTLQIAFTVTINKGGVDPVEKGRRIVAEALRAGFEKMLCEHVGWWKKFWSQSAVTVPDKKIEQHYCLVQYFYGSASRRGAPPIPLQGGWTADDGALPPWKGDYHNDMNTQLTYWPYLSANHLDEGLCFLDFLWDLLPEFKKFARDFYDAPGACVPGVMSLDGKALGGWHQYSYSPTNGVWIAHAFYLHWRYTMDKKFLMEQVYPFCRDIALFLEKLLEADKDGKLKLPLSSSPEIHDNALKAWLTPNTNYDLSLMRWLFMALAEMANVLADQPAVKHWEDILNRLDNLAVTGEGHLMLSPDESLTASHRHFSHLLAIHPLGILHVDGSERDREIIRKSLRQVEQLGTGYWYGFSFAWMSCLSARSRQPEHALRMLELYLKGFVSRNGFHLNGDYKQLGLSLYKNRPFTLEGNFAAAQAVHEMLLQSWGGKVRVFPSAPSIWSDMVFDGLRAEGAFRVSARREKGQTVWIRIIAEHDNLLQLEDPFAGRQPCWNRKNINKQGKLFRCGLNAGEMLEGGIK